MPTSDVTAAMDRLRRVKAGESLTSIYGRRDEAILVSGIINDRNTLADAYLAVQERDERLRELTKGILLADDLKPIDAYYVATTNARAILSELNR